MHVSYKYWNWAARVNKYKIVLFHQYLKETYPNSILYK